MVRIVCAAVLAASATRADGPMCPSIDRTLFAQMQSITEQAIADRDPRGGALRRVRAWCKHQSPPAQFTNGERDCWHNMVRLKYEDHGPQPIVVPAVVPPPLPEPLKTLISQGEIQRQQKLDRLHAAMRQAQGGLKGTRSKVRRSSAGARLKRRAWARSRIQHIQSKIELIEAQQGCYLPRLEWRVGSMGNLWRSFRVSQVVDSANMLVRPSRDDTDLLLWFRGWDTTTLTDGQATTVKQLAQVTKTTQYTTVLGGSNTIFVVEPLHVDLSLLPCPAYRNGLW